MQAFNWFDGGLILLVLNASTTIRPLVMNLRREPPVTIVTITDPTPIWGVNYITFCFPTCHNADAIRSHIYLRVISLELRCGVAFVRAAVLSIKELRSQTLGGSRFSCLVVT